nr:UbiD family decarboxylase domain-containing protein [Paraburkholderia sp. BL8N3]
MLPRDLFAYYQAAEKLDKELPVTVTIGHDPVVELASQAIAPRDVCELTIAGALKQRPIDVVKSYHQRCPYSCGRRDSDRGVHHST